MIDPLAQATAASEGVPPKIAAIRALTAAGYALIPLNGKHPAVKDWQDTPHGKYGERELAGGNYGVVLKAGDLVIDVDPRNFAPNDNPLRRLVQQLGVPLKSFSVRTGGGGMHVYFKMPTDLLVRNSLSQFPGVEFKAAGRQVVGPGSIHPDSGKEYEIAVGSPTIEEIVDAPSVLLALIKRTAVPFDEVGTGKFVNDAATQGRFLDFLQHVAEPSVSGKGGDNNAFKVACRGRDFGLPPALTWELMLEVWNPKCSPPWDAEELKAKVIHAYRYAHGAVGTAHPSADFEPVVPLADMAKAAQKEKEEPLSWDLTPQGGMKKTFVNLLNLLKAPQGGLAKVFGRNDFTGRVEFTNPAPWHQGQMPRYVGVGDSDLKLLKGYLAKKHGFETTIATIEEAVTVVAYDNRFHPVREYLTSLKWDGVPRLDFWLRDYLGAPDDAYTRACARKTLCAAVMRVMRPGVKFDHVLLLEGRQGIGKSTVCKILGGPWAKDFSVDPHNKDTIQLMQGGWILELAELEITRKADMDALKAFITRGEDQARLAYGRTVGEFPRQSIFIGSKNPTGDNAYLTDEENRRWWPVPCDPPNGIFNFAGLKAARNQLFAEAVALVSTGKGERLDMDTVELQEAAREVVGQRHTEHEWTDRIAGWLEEEGPRMRTFLTTREVYIEAMGGLDKQLDRRATIAIARVLRSLGWKTGFKRINGRFTRGFERDGRVFSGAPTVEKKAAPAGVDQKVLDILGDLV